MMLTESLIQMRQNLLVVVTWRSARQTIIARSTMESEFVALEMVSSEAEWLKNFLANISLGMKPTPSVSIHCDCQSAIVIAKN